MADGNLLHALISPVALAFLLGLIAAALRSELRLADSVHSAISSFLLLAIGLKGGVGLASAGVSEVALPVAAAVVLGLLSPLIAWAIFGLFTRLDPVNRGALAAHYGSTSLVTFTAATTFVEAHQSPAPGYMPTLLAVLEVPGIIVGLLLALRGTQADRASLKPALREVISSKSVVLLVGGLVIGASIGSTGYEPIKPFFGGLFQGVLVLFLLDLGVMAGNRLRDIKRAGFGLVAAALTLPLVNGAIGVAVGTAVGLNVGGAALLGVLVGSSSYIAAPAAVRLALPQANPAYYLTASLGVTFPFNLLLGIPLLHELSKLLH